MPLIFDNEIVERFSRHLEKARNVVIVSHVNPDGDAVGSSLAMYHWLSSSFYAGAILPDISVVLPNPCPFDSSYLPGADLIVNAKYNIQLCEDKIEAADLIIGVDFNKAQRVEPLDKALSQSMATKMLVDHHHNPDNDMFGTVVSLPDSSSTCEMLYWLFAQIIGDCSITDNVARCLYHGINTDTGCFSYANESSSLYEAVAALMRHDLHAEDVHNNIFNGYSFSKMRLLSFLLSERMKIFEDEGFAYIYVSDSDLKARGCTLEDLEGIVNYTLLMRDIKVGALVKESDGKVRISFRSKNDFDVNDFARRLFDGGGHKKASGATSPYDFGTTLKVLEDAMLKQLRNK